jgi:hypothetical protein
MNNTAPRNPSTSPLPAELRSTVQALLAEEGPARASDRLGVSISALFRACAGQPIRRGTAALMLLGLEKRSTLDPVAFAAAATVATGGRPPDVEQKQAKKRSRTMKGPQ